MLISLTHPQSITVSSSGSPVAPNRSGPGKKGKQPCWDGNRVFQTHCHQLPSSGMSLSHTSPQMALINNSHHLPALTWTAEHRHRCQTDEETAGRLRDGFFSKSWWFWSVISLRHQDLTAQRVKRKEKKMFSVKRLINEIIQSWLKHQRASRCRAPCCRTGGCTAVLLTFWSFGDGHTRF